MTADYTHLTGDKTYMLYGNDNAYTVNTNKKSVDLVDLDAVSVGATYRINPQVRTSIGYGAVFYGNEGAGKNDNLQQGWLNVFYNPTKPLTFGAEYIYGERAVDKYSVTTGTTTTNNPDRVGRDSRIGVMAKYDF